MVDILAFRLLSTNRELYLDAFVKAKSRLYKSSVLPKLDSDYDDYWKIIELVCQYHDKHKTLPGAKAIQEFSRFDKSLGVTEGWLAHVDSALRNLKDMTEVRLKQASDPNILIDEVINLARIEFMKYTAQGIVDIAMQGPSQLDEKGKKKNPTGPDDAKTFAIKQFAKDIVGTNSEWQGIWQENTDAVVLRLNEYLSGKQTRIFSGYPQIDKRFVMRLGKTLVIAGNSGDGKTMFVNSMIYNMACNGERILYNALEFSVDETWETLAFIHQRAFRDIYKLPPKHTWVQHDPKYNPVITQQNVNDMRSLITDYKSGGVPGPIDVVRMWEPEEFKAYYESNDPKQHYSVVVIDYLAHMRPQGKGGFRNESERQAAIDEMASDFVSWTHEKQKFLFVTPAQIGKTAAKDALKRWDNSDEDGDNGYTLDSLYYGNALKQDGDLVISVFSPQDLKDKTPPEMLVKCHKYRMTESFGQAVLNVDTNCGYVYDLNDMRNYPLTSAEVAVDADDDRIAKGWTNPYEAKDATL